MNRLLSPLFVLYLAFFTHLVAQQPIEKQEPITPPNPMVLEEGWKGYLEVSNEDLVQRIDDWKFSLQEIVKETEPNEPKEIQDQLNRISSSLSLYLKIRSQPKIPIPAAKPFEEVYTVDEILDILWKLRMQENERRADTPVIKAKQQYEEGVDKQIALLRQDFQRAPIRSEERLLIGLKIISKHLSFLINQEEIDKLQREREILQMEAQHLKEELVYALQHVSANHGMIKNLQIRSILLEEKRNEQARVKETVEREAIESFSIDVSEKAQTANMWWNQKVLQTSVAQGIITSQILVNRLKTIFLQLRDGQVPADIDALRTEVARMRQQIEILQSQHAEWSLLAERGQQRAKRLLSLIEENELEGETRELIQLEKNIVMTSQKTLVDLEELEQNIYAAKFLFEQVDKELLLHLHTAKKWFLGFFYFFIDLAKALQGSLNQPLVKLGRTSITLLNIFYFLLIILLTFWLAHLLMRTMTRVARRHKLMQRSLVYRISRLMRYSIIAIGILFGLSALGFDFTTFLLIAGGLSVGIGLGLQEIFRNFLSGVMILFESYIKVGDYVELEKGGRGTIREINFRNTVVATNDGVDILVPNSEMISNRVTNWTLKDPFRRIHVPFSVAYGTNKDDVAVLVKEAAKNVSATLQHGWKEDPNVYLTKLGNHGLEMELVVWVHEKATVRLQKIISAYLWEIERILRENNIEIPYPQLDIHQKS